ncbi:MAG: nucleotidyl transferase AbiEii/AbiGii toxin family protein [Acidimicrobiia bacterium]
MTDDHPLAALPIREKEPRSRRVLLTWLDHAARAQNVAPKRLNRLVANSIVLAVLQSALHDDRRCAFLVKGGTQIELRLGLRARASADLDTLFRGDFASVLASLDRALAAGWGPFSFTRSEPEVINVPSRLVKPERMDIAIRLRGETVLSVQLEVAADEGGAGDAVDMVRVPPLGHFGLATPEEAAALALEYQVAQKLHACTDPHTDEMPNDRVHDVVDLMLVRAAYYAGGSPMELRAACVAIFDARFAEAAAAGVVPRPWPPTVVAHPHWAGPFDRLATEVGLDASFVVAIAEVNTWIDEIDAAPAVPEDGV